MKILLAQLNTTVGDFPGNGEKLLDVLDRWGDQVDLILTPELSLPGYHPLDLLFRPGFATAQEAALARLRRATVGKRAALAVGAALANSGKGNPFFNGLLLLAHGQTVFAYHKRLLPDYGVFDEARHFEPGLKPGLWQKDHARLGFLICEDGWNTEAEDPYPLDPVADLAGMGAEILLSVNASPGTLGKGEKRRKRFSRAAARHGLPLIYLNLVGGNDDLIFDGESFVLDANGETVFSLPAFHEAELLLEWDPAGKKLSVASVSGGTHENRSWEGGDFLLGQLGLGLTDYLAKCGFDRVAVGVSGGIDSAVTLALARSVLPPDRLAGVAMPSPHSTPESLELARQLCRNLGVPLHTHPIDAELRVAMEMFTGSFGEAPSRLTLENLQARIRGRVLMAFSNQWGHLILSTGNKSELSVGYCTLYGDMSGGLSPLGDLYKGEVTILARALNQSLGQEAIPEAIITREPSAELFPGQKDSDSLPPYPVLDAALRLHLEGAHLSAEERERDLAILKQAQFDRFPWLERVVDRAEYKRRQAPPALRVHELAFGRGRRTPVAHHFQSR